MYDEHAQDFHNDVSQAISLMIAFYDAVGDDSTDTFGPKILLAYYEYYNNFTGF